MMPLRKLLARTSLAIRTLVSILTWDTPRMALSSWSGTRSCRGVAFGWDGTFVLGWTDRLGHLGDRSWEINYQRFTVPPGL